MNICQVRKLTTEHNAGLALNKEARKLAMRLAKDQMNLKAKIKQLQGVKNVSTHVSWASVGIFVTLSLIFNTMYQNLIVINANCCFCLIRLMMYHQQQQMVIKRVNRVPRR